MRGQPFIEREQLRARFVVERNPLEFAGIFQRVDRDAPEIGVPAAHRAQARILDLLVAPAQRDRAPLAGKAQFQLRFDGIDVEQGSVGVEDDSGERGCGPHKRSLFAFAWQRQLAERPSRALTPANILS